MYIGGLFLYLSEEHFQSIHLTATIYLSYLVNYCSHYANIISNQMQASIPCIFCLIYVNILLFTKCCMGGRSNRNICTITTQTEPSICKLEE